MPARLQEQVLARIDQLIVEGRRITGSYQQSEYGGPWSNLPEADIRAFLVAGAAEVVRIAGKESEFARQLIPPPRDLSQHLPSMPFVPGATLGVLRALRDAVAGGHLEQLAVRIRGALHDDMLQQAAELLEGNYFVAAAVVAGGVLENHLRQLCATRGLQPQGNGINAFDAALRRSDVYSQPMSRQVQMVADVRNHAAHGQYDRVRQQDVDDVLRFVRRLLAEVEG